MFSFFVSFVSCALLTLLVIKYAKRNGTALDSDYEGVQKFHSHHVARIGGVPIFLAVLFTGAISVMRLPALGPWLASLVGCGFIAMAGGIVEDYTGRVSPARRLLLTMLAALFA
jgi:UDP-N-acetylmuramyl pentapeptide phosphotransferase/UDP-N-acetylglucosamine-1-phosphate transferase